MTKPRGGKGKSSKAVQIKTRSTSTEVTEAKKSHPRPLPASLERRSKKAKSTIPPVWIKYYEREAKDVDSPYGRGFSQPTDYFENLMENVVEDEDALYEVLKQNPEACAFLYSDGSGTMRIVHHLTATVHGSCIIVGLEGFGGKSGQVKVLRGSKFVERVDLDDNIKKQTVPKLEAFLTEELDEIGSNDPVDPADDAQVIMTLGQVFGESPRGYFIHPRWLPIVYPHIGADPSNMVDAIIDKARKDLGETLSYRCRIKGSP